MPNVHNHQPGSNRDAGIYRLSDAGVQRLLLQEGCWTPDSLLYSLILGLGIGVLGRAPFWPLVLIYTLFILFHLKLFRHFPQQKAGWSGYEVVVESDRVLARKRDAVECTVNRSEITKIIEHPIHGLWIYTQDRSKIIRAPKMLTGYQKMRTMLTDWVAIERRGPRQLWIYFGMPASLAFLASTLLVRSRYVFFPLLAIAGFYLLRFARISIKTWMGSYGPSPSGTVKDPNGVLALPFMLLALLTVKLVWILLYW